MDQNNPLNKARELILSLSKESDAASQIQTLQALPQQERQKKLDELYATAETKAKNGDVKGISLMLHVFTHFHDSSHDRMLLHYIAEAEANYALAISKGEKEEDFHHEDLQKALTIISEAFADADNINKSLEIS